MAQRIGNVDEWRLLIKEDVFHPAPGLENEERTVALELNAPQETALYIITEEPVFDPYEESAEGYQPTPLKGSAPGEKFLVLVKGRDRVEFTARGPFRLESDGGDVWYKTTDGTTPAARQIAPIIFTRIANRRARNPNLEMMEFKMNQRLNQRLAAMEEEVERRANDAVNNYLRQRDIRTPPAATGGKPTAESAAGEGGESPAPAAGKPAAGKGEGGEAKAGKKPAAAAASDD